MILEGQSVAIPWKKCSERLAPASAAERTSAVLSPSGYGINWPLIDEDLAAGPWMRATVYWRLSLAGHRILYSVGKPRGRAADTRDAVLS